MTSVCVHVSMCVCVCLRVCESVRAVALLQCFSHESKKKQNITTKWCLGLTSETTVILKEFGTTIKK